MLDATLTRHADLALSDERQEAVRAIRDYCAREWPADRLAAVAADHERLDEASLLALRQLGEMGFTGLTIPEAYGGSDGGYLDAMLFLEEATRGQAPIAPYGVTLIVAGVLRSFGTDAQKAEHLGEIARGGVLAIAMSEPEAGSDVANLACTARRVDDGWVLNGVKVWCSYAHLASHIVVVAREPGTARHDGLSMLLVPRPSDGLQVTGIETMVGRDTNYLYLDDCHVGEDALVGTAGMGWMQLMAGLNVERLIIGAMSLGIAQRAFDDALAYAKERRQFGRPIGSFQATQHVFADLATKLAQARLFVRYVAGLVDTDPARMLPQEASMAKLACTELAKECALAGMQILGGYGYSTEYPMERHLRTAVVSTVYGGTSEIQRNIIAKTLGL